MSGSGMLLLGGTGVVVPSPGALIVLGVLRLVGINRNWPTRIFFLRSSAFHFERTVADTLYKLAIVVAVSPI